MGSPPRGRGKGVYATIIPISKGITPAWAGKRPLQSSGDIRGWDHPRIGGEKATAFGSTVTEMGSPPRGQGKEVKSLLYFNRVGITPAWAGKRNILFSMMRTSTDHPRTGGEKLRCKAGCGPQKGSPPRGRGKVAGDHYPEYRDRITPAWAGKSFFHHSVQSFLQDHPRVGGEK